MKIIHIAIYVNDLENVKKFFIKYFNAVSNELYHNEKKGFKSYFLSFSDGTRLEIMNKADMHDQDDGANRLGFHIAFSVGSKENVDNLTNIFENDGYEILSKPRITGDGYYESCILGVEGIIIEITI